MSENTPISLCDRVDELLAQSRAETEAGNKHLARAGELNAQARELLDAGRASSGAAAND